MFTEREEELLLKSKLKTEERAINLRQMKMEMTYFGKMFMDTVTIIDQTKPLKLPFIKKKSGLQESSSSRNSNHNNSQSLISKERWYEENAARKQRSSSLISNIFEKQNIKRNNDKSLENNKTMVEDENSRDQSLRNQKRGLPKIIKNKYFKQFNNEKMERIMSQRNVTRITEAVQQPKYKMGSVLGQGAYATVRLAKSETGQLVAIKCYDKSKINDNQKLQNIKRQIKILRKLKHPFIIQLMDVTQNDTHINIVTELIENMSILDLIKLNMTSRLSQIEAKPIFKQLAEAVSYLHGKNILHRDIKLQNVLISKSKHVKLIDFGFSTQDNSKNNTFCGTPSYVSPEMISKKGYGKSVDVWALGITLYKILCGHFPFKAVSHKTLYSKISKGSFKFVVELSVKAQILISKMLCVQVSSRPTIDEVLQQPWVLQI